MRRNFLLLVLGFGLCALSFMVVVVVACPSEMCVCKWKNGKQTAECSNRRLAELPGGLDSGTQVLNFTGNSLTYLKAEWFYQLNLINLQKIFLMRNEIARIHNRAFQGLSNLVELDLSDNLLATVPSESFPDYGSLMRLALNGNPIKALRSSAFKHLPFLTTLELTNCQIELVENEAFLGMDNLEWLRLDGNRITTIRGTHLLPDSLHGISLQSNRWACDCTMLDLHRWLSASTVPQTEEPKCVQPTRLAGSTIRSVDRGQLACLPEILPKSLSLEIAENRNLTLTCKVEAVPAATISWWFQGRALENHTIIGTNIHLLMTVTMEQGEAERRMDLLISNTTAETNGTFVCTAENAAGRVQANYTVRVIGKEEPVVEQVKFPFEYHLILIAGGAGVSIIVLVIVFIILLKCCCQRRNRHGGRRGACNGNNNGANDNGGNGHWKKNPPVTSTGTYNYANGGDGIGLNNGSVGGGPGIVGGRQATTLITDKGGLQVGMMNQAADHQLNGGLSYGHKQDVIMYVTSGLVAADQQQDLQHPLGGMQQRGGSACATIGDSSVGSSNAASPPHSSRNYSPDPINPDLINDTEKQRLTAMGSNGSGGQQNVYCSSNNNNNGGSSEEGQQKHRQQRDLVAQSYNRQQSAVPQSHLGTLPRTSRLMSNSNSASAADHHHHHQMQQQQQLQAHHHHQADVHLNPGCFLAPLDHPVEYSLTNVMAVLPPQSNHQLVAAHHHLQQQQQQQQQSMNFTYRTLPHRMKIRNIAAGELGGGGVGVGGSGNTIRFSRDAEFLTSLQPPQPHSFDMYTSPNVRYTAEGYPYTPVTVPYLAASIPGSTAGSTIATTQQVAAFQQQQQQQYQDLTTLQFLPSPPEGYKSTDNGDGADAEQIGTGQQQWPVCLPGYHHQKQTQNVPTSQIVPIKTNFGQRFASPLASPASSVTSSTSSSKLSTSTNTTTHSGSAGNNNNNNSNSLNIISTGNQTPALQSPSGAQQMLLPAHTPPPPVISKRCVGAQTVNSGGAGNDELTGGCGSVQVVSRRVGLLANAATSTLKEVDETEEETEAEEGEGVAAAEGGRVTTKTTATQRGGNNCRHLNGPLADSPDEGYVGDSGHDGGSSD